MTTVVNQGVGISGKYLTFILGDEGYGIPVMKVKEIIRLKDTTTIPKMPDHVLGVINLRGKIVPVFDLRIKFGIPSHENSERTCVIVAQVLEIESGERKMVGLVVDSVEEVIMINNDQIAPSPDFGQNINTEYILGIGKVGDRVRMLVDIDRIVGDEKTELSN